MTTAAPVAGTPVAGTPVALTRAALAVAGIPADPAPVRIVHLGLGAFHRAHQVWFTQHAADGAGWGIASFTGRSPRMAETLSAQDGVYALVERGPEDDRVEIMTSIAEAHDGADLDRLAALLTDPAVAVVTLTITEAGYLLRGDGRIDADDPAVTADISVLRTGSGSPATALGRLLHGLRARREADAGPIAIVSCDNIPANGTALGRALGALAAEVDDELAAWLGHEVSFVSTSVDRITPATHGEVDAVVAAGWQDAATVVTEPFADWVLQGDFPAGRPQWETAGARFVDEIAPWEDRKLWLLNGAHTLLAAAGLAAGHATVAQAFADPGCRRLVDAFWAEAVTCLPDGVEHIAYRDALAGRFANPRIVHRLDQIAADCTTKVRYRLAPIARRRRERGEDADGTAAALAVWVSAAVAGLLPPGDREADAVRDAASAPDPVAALLHLVTADPDPDFVGRVRAQVRL